MNWYLLNLPLIAVIATAVVAPIMVVTCRVDGSHDIAPATAIDAAALGLVPAAKASGPSERLTQDTRELALV